MERAKNVSWIIPFKKSGLVRVNNENATFKSYV